MSLWNNIYWFVTKNRTLIRKSIPLHSQWPSASINWLNQTKWHSIFRGVIKWQENSVAPSYFQIKSKLCDCYMFRIKAVLDPLMGNLRTVKSFISMKCVHLNQSSDLLFLVTYLLQIILIYEKEKPLSYHHSLMPVLRFNLATW